MGRRSGIPWAEIEVDFTLGALSLRQIAEKFGIAESNLRARAKREGWSRGDGTLVREATREALAAVSTARVRQIGAEIGAEQARRYEGKIEEIALTASDVAIEHRAAARRGMNAAMELLRELEASIRGHVAIEAELQHCQSEDPQRGALIEKLLGLRGRVETLDKWATAFTKLAGVEREAHDMNSDNQANEIDALLLKIAAEAESKKTITPLRLGASSAT